MNAKFVVLCLLAAVCSFLLASAQPDSSYVTLESGAPVDISTLSESVGTEGALLLEDYQLVERLGRQNRERIPERTVHARGTVAKGTFSVYSDVSNYTTAKVFQPGASTPVAVRFSTVIHGQQSPEYLRDPRGFAVKFYTEEGNYDLVGINFPVFFIRDGIRFPEFIHAFKPNPATGVSEWWRVWDYFSFVPESTNMFTFLMDDLGIPRSYRNMNGSGVHTYIWINAENQPMFVRYTWKTLQGVETFDDEGDAVDQDWNYATMDLTQSINNGSYPVWELYVQLIKPADMNSFGFNILDTTHQWPEDEIPMVLVGAMTLHENVQHHFLEAEQIAFSPARMVPGILPSNEKMLQARIFSYQDAQRYRLGVNNHLIPINAPRCPFQQVQQDGFMNTLRVQNTINYFPSRYANVTQAPPQPNINRDQSNAKYFTEMGFKERAVIPMVDDFSQPAWRYSTWDSSRQMRFARRIAATLMTPGVTQDLSDFWIERWTNVSSQLGSQIAKLVNTNARIETLDINSISNEDILLFDNFAKFRKDFIRSSGAV